MKYVLYTLNRTKFYSTTCPTEDWPELRLQLLSQGMTILEVVDA